MQSSSSDSDSGNFQKFQSAVDPKFSFDLNTKAVVSNGKAEKKVSLRPNQLLLDYKFNELKTTPEFRKHVAKKLTQKMDSQIKFVNKKLKAEADTNENDESGIYLLTTSKQFTKIEEERLEKRPKIISSKKKHKKHKSGREDSSCDEDEEQSRFASAAVSVDWIMTHRSPYQ